MNIIIYMWKTGRFVAKHGHLQSIHRPWHSAGNCKVAYSVFSPASETTSTMKGSHKDKTVCVNITFEVNNRYSVSGVYTTYIVYPVAPRGEDKQRLADTTQTPNLEERQKKSIGQEFET